MIIHFRKDGHKKTFGVHSIILPCFIPNTLNKSTIDHKDRDPNNNRLSNLLYATRTEQNHNRGKQEDASSSFLGIYYHKNRRKWEAGITLKNGEKKCIGDFDRELDAVFARYRAEVSEWRDFANTNVL